MALPMLPIIQAASKGHENRAQSRPEVKGPTGPPFVLDRKNPAGRGRSSRAELHAPLNPRKNAHLAPILLAPSALLYFPPLHERPSPHEQAYLPIFTHFTYDSANI